MEPLPHLPLPIWTPELEASFQHQGQLVTTHDGCIVWTGPMFQHGGYGRFYVASGQWRVPGKNYRAHRVAYAWKYGDPGDAVLDHICHDPLACDVDVNGWCRHRRCVNPDHLAPTTRGENVRRGIPGSPLWHPLGNSLKQVCVNGHEFTEENTYLNPRGERQCRQCLNEAQKRYYRSNRDAVNAKKRASRQRVVYDERPCQHCGLPFTPKRSTARFCLRRECINSRQNANRRQRVEKS